MIVKCCFAGRMFGGAAAAFQVLEADAKSDRKFHVSRDNQQGDA